MSPAWVLEGDIKGCFDNISHDWLLSNIPMDTRILSKWLKAGYMEKGVFFHTGSGTPQGGIISPLLANMALDGLEEDLMRTFRKVLMLLYEYLCLPSSLFLQLFSVCHITLSNLAPG